MINRFVGEYFFLSNFYPSPVKINDLIFPTAEHAFQAMKAWHEKDKLLIAQAKSPGAAKRLGKSVIIIPWWDDIRLKVMLYVVNIKFTINHHLKNRLVDTEPSFLVEGNMHHDNFWGNCICPRCRDIEGHNHHGKILMAVRGHFILMED